MDELTLHNLIADQAEIYVSLEKVDKNLRKLELSKRNENNYARYWNQAKAFWANFVKNHHEMLRNKVIFPEAYSDRINDVIKIYKTIKDYIELSFPGMVKNKKDELEELSDITQPVTQELLEGEAVGDQAIGGKTDDEVEDNDEDNGEKYHNPSDEHTMIPPIKPQPILFAQQDLSSLYGTMAPTTSIQQTQNVATTAQATVKNVATTSQATVKNVVTTAQATVIASQTSPCWNSIMDAEQQGFSQPINVISNIPLAPQQQVNEQRSPYYVMPGYGYMQPPIPSPYVAQSILTGSANYLGVPQSQNYQQQSFPMSSSGSFNQAPMSSTPTQPSQAHQQYPLPRSSNQHSFPMSSSGPSNQAHMGSTPMQPSQAHQQQPSPHSSNQSQFNTSGGSTTQDSLASVLSQLTQSIIAANRATSQNDHGPTLGKLKIPRLDVEEFTGDILKYQNFKKTFQVMVDRAKLDSIDQFLLLQSKVKGTAANELPRQVSDKSLQEAWTNLDNRYNNQRKVVEATIKNFMGACEQGPNSTTSILARLQAHQEAVFNLNNLQLSAMDVLRCLAIAKMDKLTSQRFNDFLGEAAKFPSEKDYRTFLEKEYIISTTVDNRLKEAQSRSDGKPFQQQSNNARKNPTNGKTTNTHATTGAEPTKGALPSSTPRKPNKCFICAEEHIVIECPKFKAAPNREQLLREQKICIYCMKHRYEYRKSCKTRDKLRCEVCSQNHIKELHDIPSEFSQTTSTHLTRSKKEEINSVILPTAIANLMTQEGSVIPVRCLIDQCSQSNYVTESLVQQLRLKKMKTNVTIHGVGGIAGTAQSMVTLSVKLDAPYDTTMTIPALVVKKITSALPTIPESVTRNQSNKKLADPHSNHPAQIPVLIGAKVLAELFLPGVEKQKGLLYQQTKLGWVVSGQTQGKMGRHVSTHVSLTELETQLINFWDMPLTKTELHMAEDEFCEQQFLKNHYRTEEGRYVVPIPWKEYPPKLGNSYNYAKKFYLGQEYRWNQNPIHKKMSDEFMEEYHKLGHMERVPENEMRNPTGEVYYIPWISVLRQDAVTTKLRNVFNGSAPSDNGTSLNHQILPGPKLQTHIFDTLTRIRKYKFIYSSDITKMFRQILLPETDQNKLRIIWRANKEEPLAEWKMKTVVYGLVCSPWQAIRTLRQMADDCTEDESVRRIIKEGMYMDDLLYGADDVATCQHQISEITKTLASGKMELTKWMSNHPEVLTLIDDTKKIDAYVDMGKYDSSVKTLGLQFHPRSDSFSFKIKTFEKITYTKRGLLSFAATYWDPCGWLLPVIMQLRMCVQSLWQQKLGWDEPIDETTKKIFDKCVETMVLLNEFKIPRWTGGLSSDQVQLIGFCDASGDGYAAMIYSRVKSQDSWIIRLIAARGRVTPLKTKAAEESKLVTIPKLELEAIALLTELYKEVKDYFNCDKLIAYTDSEVALSWVRRLHDATHKVVKNRVNKIRKVLNPNDLHHVYSAENPADGASRGWTPDKFMDNKDFWLFGPQWLTKDDLPTTPATVQEDESNLVFASTTEENENFLEHFSNWERILRVTARCLRMKNRNTGELTAEELIKAFNAVIKFQQHAQFKEEINTLQRNKTIPKKHWFNSLRAYMDDEGFLRVGGRLAYSTLPRNQKHPFILRKCHVLDVYIRYLHTTNGHAASALLERLVRENFYVPALSSRVKKCIRECKRCVRWAARTIQPQLGQYPTNRVSESPSFSSTGCDLAGPFLIKPSKLKFEKVIKAWVVLFVCMATRAVHLEICTDLTTENFLQSFQRFASRRGNPREIHSDRGTNLVGSKRLLQEQWNTICAKAKSELAIQTIIWKLLPPGSPSFGGIWESGVKSMKFFIKRMENVERLTYEEFHTLLCRVEMIMNSRPLYPNSVDPDKAPALTPFQLITNRSPTLSPLDMEPDRRLPLTKRWMLIYQIQRQFWERFQNEYILQLHKSYKHKFPARNLKVDDVVLLQDPFSPPLAWSMGRITRTYPDKKGAVRVVEVRTANKDKDPMIRAVTRLVPLFTEEESELSSTQENSSNNNKAEETSPATSNSDENDDNIKIKTKDSSPKRAQTHKQSITAVRRSPRNIKNINLASVILGTLCCLLIVQPLSGLSVKPLTPGLHFQPMSEVSVKVLDLIFTLNTTMNVTQDLETLGEEQTKFKNLCTEIGTTNHTDLQKYCNELQQTLATSVTAIIANIKSSFNPPPHRGKRWGSVIARGALKVAPHIALLSFAVYQEIENQHLESTVKALQSKLIAVSSLMNEVTDLQFAAIEANMNQLQESQHKQQLESAVTDYFNSVSSLANEVLWKYKNLQEVRPIDELKDYVRKLQNSLIDVELPMLADLTGILNSNPPVRTLINDLAVVTYQIPLVSTKKYTKYLIVSVPDVRNQAILLDNNDMIDQMAINHVDNTYFRTLPTNRLAEHLYHNVSPMTLTTCISSRLTHATTTTNVTTDYREKDCNITTINSTVNQFLRVDESDWAVIISPNPSSVVISCNNTKTRLTQPYNIIQFQNCKVSDGEEALVANFVTDAPYNATALINPDPYPISSATVLPFTEPPSIKKLKEQLATELESSASWTDAYRTPAISAGVAVLIILTLIIGIWKCYRTIRRKSAKHELNKTKRTWLAEWYTAGTSTDNIADN